jgi:hypothetical protein
MKRHFPTSVSGWAIGLAVVLIAVGLLEPVHGQIGEVALVLQQTPSQGGTITPGPGVHHFSPNAEVTLTAIPNPGYQFTCWLGDVSDPAAQRTVTYLDRPKIIVAVFEQAKYATPLATGRTSGGGLISSATDFGGRGPSGAVGGSPGSVIAKHTKSEPSVPESESPASSAPVPEPATAILLAVGGLFALARRGARKHA